METITQVYSPTVIVISWHKLTKNKKNIGEHIAGIGRIGIILLNSGSLKRPQDST